ncbi:AAA family ATPase [Anaerotignum sp.]|uniref:AAA family ATPase n=1 Tax=Anaerotignum sp. TaxID=2039241 RepID=UPI0027149970|nr:AAA family ATPase [Anaerotignum sp.]
MALFICNSEDDKEYKVGTFILQHNNSWNDWWRYENLYTLYYINKKKETIEIGQVKIGQVAGKVSNIPELPEEFQHLDSQKFISLGQDTDYYDSLNKLGVKKRETVLNSLNDIAFKPDLLQRYMSLDVFSTSLTRGIPISTIENQFRRMANGGAKLTRYKFKYNYPNSDDTTSTQLKFSVVPESNPPTNIHVLIGRNGVGKTWVLKNMINTIYREECGFGEFVFGNRRNRFTNIVCLAFSAFDEFPTVQDNDNMKYTYIGIKSTSDGEEMSLDQQFAYSMKLCMTKRTRYERWKKIVGILNSDPIFSEINIIDCIDWIKENYTRSEAEQPIKELFNTLSSGHKIVALTITRLVETVEECTLVLLDEPELHLHPPLLSAFTRALSQLLINRNGVAVISTHSPVILQEVPKSCVWIIRRSGEEVAADRPHIETFGENVGVLTSEVFGLEVTNSGFHKMLSDVLNKEHGDYDTAKDEFDGQLGAEALGILKVMALQFTEE